MPGATPNYGLPYQSLGDAPNGPTLGQDLAGTVETELTRIDGDISGLDTDLAALDAAKLDVDGPGTIYHKTYAGTTDANGFLTIAHTAGWVPAGGWTCTTNPSTSFAVFWGMDQIDGDSVRVRFMHSGGVGPLVSANVSGFLFLVRP